MTTLAAALPVAALLFAALGWGFRWQMAAAGSRFRRRAGFDGDVLFRDAAEERLDLSTISAGGPAGDLIWNRRLPAGKRLLDIAAASALLVICAPLLIVTAVAIKLDSFGPVFFRQKRIGLDGQVFHIFKFRSMVADAERDGPRWAAKDDRRITKVGRLIRKTRIDEIPQTWNVLRGEMSFVGPRPERPEFVELLEKEIPNYHLRHLVKPGITGWAQIKYVYGASVEDARIKLQYDLHYIKHFSLARDVRIIAATVRVALFGLGSR